MDTTAISACMSCAGFNTSDCDICQRFDKYRRMRTCSSCDKYEACWKAGAQRECDMKTLDGWRPRGLGDIRAPKPLLALPPGSYDGWVEATAMGAQAYPDNNPKTVLGLAKPSLSCVPPSALIHLGRAMADGKRKYGLMNWREKRVSSSIYVDAAMRHLLAWWDGEEVAEDSGVHHLGHVMACMSILLDGQEFGNLNDDRPTPGTYPALVKRFTEKKETTRG